MAASQDCTFGLLVSLGSRWCQNRCTNSHYQVVWGQSLKWGEFGHYGSQFFLFSKWIMAPILVSMKWQFKYKISSREFSIFRTKFTWYEELRCGWGPFQLHKAVRWAGFSSRILPAVGCHSTICMGFVGSPCKEKGARVALGVQSSIRWLVCLLCEWVASQGAPRRGTGEKQGSQALLLFGHSQLLEQPFGHHAART